MRRIPALALALLVLTAAPLAAQDPLDQLAARSGAFVQAVKNDLVVRGVIPTPQRDNCDSFQITARVAWRLRAQGAKLIPKTPAQNGCTWLGVRYSHDAIAFPDGWADLLVGAGPPLNQNQPAWQFSATGPSAGAVAPFDLDPVITITTPPPVTPPPSGPSSPVNPGELAALTFQLAVLTERVETLQQVINHLALVQARGLTGGLFGYQLTLLPVPGSP